MNMGCIISFLSDSNQKSLRYLAQTQSDNYESALENYKNLFISNYEFSLQWSKNCPNKQTCMNCLICNQIIDDLEDIKRANLINFLDELRIIYMSWINGDWGNAIFKLEKLIEEYNLLKFTMPNTENEIFYKGRVVKNEILTKWDMFHIPFNKRYLIKNQRYSITGQPLIYLGLSILDVVEELDVTDEEFNHLKTSTYQLPSAMKIFDLRGNIFDDIMDYSLDNIFDYKINTFKEKHYDKILYRNILSSVCSFEKRKEHKHFHFCEEYVLPQLLAQVVKKNNFDGIRYISTKKFNNIEKDAGYNNDTIVNYKTLYKENLALFTNIDYDKSDVYDKNLYEKIKISRPLDIFRLEDISMDSLKTILDEIEFFRKQKLYNEANQIYQKFEREFTNIIINGQKYLTLNIGKIHINHIYILMSSILQNCIIGGNNNEKRDFESERNN